jgi:ABC-type branched-subunit amino acid transport system ATPase component
MRLCEHVVVLQLGATLADGRPDDIKRDPRVVAAYLGAA